MLNFHFPHHNLLEVIAVIFIERAIVDEIHGMGGGEARNISDLKSAKKVLKNM